MSPTGPTFAAPPAPARPPRAATPARNRRAPRPPPAGTGDDVALLALEAFDAGAALVDLTHRRLAWCSPGFTARCCVAADDTLAALEERLPGTRAALAKLAGAGAAPSDERHAHWRSGGGDACAVEAALVRPGLAALRLGAVRQLDPDDAQAARRHLEDRERLLFTSRTLAVGEMASTLAHELNQPIGTVANVLRGMRARLERGGAAAAPAELQQGVQLALEQALFAASVIARIREYTHSRRPRRERLDLGAAVQQAATLLDWELRRAGVEFAFERPGAPCLVEGDEVMLQQLFVNLLRNAVEAMHDNPPEAPRRLQLTLACERGDAVLTVRDSGPGLPKDADERLFVPFQSSKPNGMGIGLNICRSFVELHQGRLWFTPNDDGACGCTFHVALPLVSAGSR